MKPFRFLKLCVNEVDFKKVVKCNWITIGRKIFLPSWNKRWREQNMFYLFEVKRNMVISLSNKSYRGRLLEWKNFYLKINHLILQTDPFYRKCKLSSTDTSYTRKNFGGRKQVLFLKGDRNTRFFHNLIYGRRKKLSLNKIMNEDGRTNI